MAQLVPVEEFDIVIFGATGDLAQRKLFPALYHRWLDDQIPEGARIIATSRTEMSREDFLAQTRQSHAEFHPSEKVDEARWTKFAEQMDYVALDAVNEGGNWPEVAGRLEGREEKIRLFYLALPPGIYGSVCENIGATGLVTPKARVVLEKPIGTDLESAREINERVGRVFREDAIFRIDHYLGKETVQNLLILRFANVLFEPIWNSTWIDHVQISACETVGAGMRGDYYDGAGAMRDMVQNHLLQLLCLVAMEPPNDLDADAVRGEKLKVLNALRPIGIKHIDAETVRGQYTSGAIGSETVKGYAEELGRESGTETFVALKTHIDNWRWSGVPFYLRTGKRMASRRSEIIIQFKPVPHEVTNGQGGPLHPNRLVIRLQPDEGVRLLLMTKDPGPGGLRLRYVPLNLSYADTFEENYPDAYERLLMAVVRDNLALFMRRDEIEAAWRWVDGILDGWKEAGTKLYTYPAGVDGPVQSALLLDRAGREWLDGLNL
jgi:glucose-6-phosphate 1-dehydrogenase